MISGKRTGGVGVRIIPRTANDLMPQLTPEKKP